MNLWGKNIGLLLITTLFLFSCEDEVTEIGQELNPNGGSVGVHFVEIPVSASTVLLDSINTTNFSSQSAAFMVGKHHDPDFGSVHVSTFTQFLPSVANPKVPEGVTVDSIILTLKENYFHSRLEAEFTKKQSVSIHPLNDTIAFYKNYYSSNTIPYAPAAIGGLEFTTNPLIEDTLRIKLPVTALHYQWLEYAKNYNGEFNSGMDFVRNTKGLALVSGDDNTVVLGYNPYHSASRITYYLSDASTVVFNFLRPYEISVGGVIQNINFIRSFMHIESDRSGTPLEGITLNTEFQPADPEDNLVYMQMGTGIVPKINIQNIDAFLDTTHNIIVNQIEIIAGQVVSYSKFQDTPTAINYRFTNETNKIIVTKNIDRIPNSQGQELISNFNKSSETYKGDINNYLDLYVNNTLEVNQFFLHPIGMGYSLRQAKLPKQNIKLKIYYTRLN